MIFSASLTSDRHLFLSLFREPPSSAIFFLQGNQFCIRWQNLVLLLISEIFKGPLLRQFLAAENPINIMKNAFYFMLKALFVLSVFEFLSLFFGHLRKWLYKKAKVNFKTYDVTDWRTNNCNTHIAQYLKE